MNIVKYATNLIAAEVGLVEHVKLTTFSSDSGIFLKVLENTSMI